MPLMERMDFQDKHWWVRDKIPARLVTDHTILKKSYGCDLVVKDRRNIFWILDEILEGEFEEM